MVTDVSPLRQFAAWTYSTFTAYSVKTQAPSFGCFNTHVTVTVFVCYAESKSYFRPTYYGP